MSMKERPEVLTVEGGKVWSHEFDSFLLKAFVPDNAIDGQVNNYTFKAPLLLVFEEEKQSMDEAVLMAKSTGLADIASKYDASVLFVYPTCEGGWDKSDESLYADVIKEVKMVPDYEDGIVAWDDFFSKTFKGYFARGAIFRADIYSFGKSADYVAKNLLKKIDGEYLWGPGEITPAVCSMERLSVMPKCERTDIPVLSVGNSDEINAAFADCGNLLITDKADYAKDFNSFVKKYKRWSGQLQIEPDFEELNMTEEAGYTLVNTSDDHRGKYKDIPNHKVGYFAYYNNDIFDEGPAPLVVGFHGGGDSSMFLTFVSGWWEVAHKYGFLFVAIENHLDVTATEAIEVVNDLKKKYNIDETRMYATGFSMGSGKTWDMFQEYPDVFAGLMPCSALFPFKNNPYARPLGDWLNTDKSVPMFYSGGEKSPLPELPCQDYTCFERIQYAAGVNKLKADFGKYTFDNKDVWDDAEYAAKPDRIEKIADETRGSILTVRYYDSEDGVCRTAYASIDNQEHECRQHSCETAWKFISQFTKAKQ